MPSLDLLPPAARQSAPTHGQSAKNAAGLFSAPSRASASRAAAGRQPKSESFDQTLHRASAKDQAADEAREPAARADEAERPAKPAKSESKKTQSAARKRESGKSREADADESAEGVEGAKVHHAGDEDDSTVDGEPADHDATEDGEGNEKGTDKSAASQQPAAATDAATAAAAAASQQAAKQQGEADAAADDEATDAVAATDPSANAKAVKVTSATPADGGEPTDEAATDESTAEANADAAPAASADKTAVTAKPVDAKGHRSAVGRHDGRGESPDGEGATAASRAGAVELPSADGWAAVAEGMSDLSSDGDAGSDDLAAALKGQPATPGQVMDPGAMQNQPAALRSAERSAPAPEQPPEARFAAENHEKIVTGVRGELMPHGGSMQLKLDPPQLGSMQVALHMKDGVVTATFQTSNDEATQLLSHSLGDLRSSLEAQGITVDKLQVQQAPKDEGGNAGRDASSGGKSNGDGTLEQRNDARREQQRKDMVQRLWDKLAGKGPLDLVA